MYIAAVLHLERNLRSKSQFRGHSFKSPLDHNQLICKLELIRDIALWKYRVLVRQSCRYAVNY